MNGYFFYFDVSKSHMLSKAMLPLDDTIVAISSPPGGAARGIIRISGPQAIACVRELLRREGTIPSQLEAPLTSTDRSISARPYVVTSELVLPGLYSPLPCEVYVWPGKRSYTGEPVCELHTFGSPPLLEAAVRACCAQGARLAGPGEFTLRAFLAGRIDLVQAEAVLGTIDAVNPGQFRAALEQLAGGISRPLAALRNDLLDLLSELEAGLDFADEDIRFITPAELQTRLVAAARHLDKLAAQMAARTDDVQMVRAVLIGRPNVGKSSLFNALTGAAAIVSARPGTTRDYLVAELPLDDTTCLLIDTAGLATTEMEPAGLAELAGSARGPSIKDECRVWGEFAPGSADLAAVAQAMTVAQLAQSEIQILCLDASRPLDDWEQAQLGQPPSPGRIVAWTKCDLDTGFSPLGVQWRGAPPLHTSSLTGEGLAELRQVLRERVLALGNSAGDVVASTAGRCRESLRLAAEALARATELTVGAQGDELVATEVRSALEELGKVVGTVYTEDLLERVFSRFCIGK